VARVARVRDGIEAAADGPGGAREPDV